MEYIKSLYDDRYSRGLQQNKKWKFDRRGYYSKSDKETWLVLDTEKDLDECKYIAIWEAPGKNEVLEFTPFVWKAWQNLRKHLPDNGEKCFITNTIKYRPVSVQKGWTVKNRTPSQSEIDFATNYLRKELIYLYREYDLDKILLIGKSALIGLGCVLRGYADQDNFEIQISTQWADRTPLNSLVKWSFSVKSMANRWINIQINNLESDQNPIELRAMLVYHTSPFNYNNFSRKQSLIDGIQKFCSSN